KWSLRAGVISIGAFTMMSSITYFLYFTIQEAASPFAFELSRMHIAAGLILIATNVSLFYGGVKENRLCLIPALMFGGTMINVIIFVLLTYSLVDPFALLFIFALIPLIYCWMVVYSFYVELDPRRMQYPSNTVISYAGPISEPTEPIKYPEVV
ncbi:hypothetical protein AMK59_6234, partial [Oryctes borbonicus]